MHFEIDRRTPSLYFTHRDDTGIAVLDTRREFYIDGVIFIAIQLISDEKWWIVPGYKEDEATYEDFGPYDTPDEAAFHLRLMSSNE